MQKSLELGLFVESRACVGTAAHDVEQGVWHQLLGVRRETMGARVRATVPAPSVAGKRGLVSASGLGSEARGTLQRILGSSQSVDIL